MNSTLYNVMLFLLSTNKRCVKMFFFVSLSIGNAALMIFTFESCFNDVDDHDISSILVNYIIPEMLNRTVIFLLTYFEKRILLSLKEDLHNEIMNSLMMNGEDFYIQDLLDAQKNIEEYIRSIFSIIALVPPMLGIFINVWRFPNISAIFFPTIVSTFLLYERRAKTVKKIRNVEIDQLDFMEKCVMTKDEIKIHKKEEYVVKKLDKYGTYGFKYFLFTKILRFITHIFVFYGEYTAIINDLNQETHNYFAVYVQVNLINRFDVKLHEFLANLNTFQDAEIGIPHLFNKSKLRNQRNYTNEFLVSKIYHQVLDSVDETLIETNKIIMDDDEIFDLISIRMKSKIHLLIGHVAFLPFESPMFDTNILENILFATPYTEDTFYERLEELDLVSLIRSKILKIRKRRCGTINRFIQLLKEKDVEFLSCGQKRILCIVRVLLSNAEIKLLSHPFWHIDNSSKKVLAKAIAKSDNFIITSNDSINIYNLFIELSDCDSSSIKHYNPK